MKNTAWKLWNLHTKNGRQYWEFSGTEQDLAELSTAFRYDKIANANSSDRVYRAKSESGKPCNETEIPLPGGLTDELSQRAFKSAYQAIHFYQQLQADEGHWPGDYGGPLFLLPGLVIASYITETPFTAAEQILMKQYFLNHQNADGGWGLHLEGHSTMFGTVLQYVALRILGEDKDSEELRKARNWILENGGATGVPSWGKFYLSVLGVYEWKGNNSLFPEMWLLPKWLPFYPGKYWCHTRMVYLPMAYCFGQRFSMQPTTLTEELKTELYKENYRQINWQKARNHCAKADSYYPKSPVLKAMNRLLNGYEKMNCKGLRKKALQYCLQYIHAEDEQTNYINIGPVNQVINSICVYHAYGKNSEPFKKHVERWKDYLWVAEDGMKMQGYNGSQLWDTVFALQAITEGGFEKVFPETIRKAHQFIDHHYIRHEVQDYKKFFRHSSQGGWPFSTLEHSWPITDCTAEGLKISLQNSTTSLSQQQLTKTADLLLSLQNKDGGWASYELTRAPKWLEWLNPSEIFGNIMIDYSYTECTSACVQSLLAFSKYIPEYRKNEIEQAIEKAVAFILSQQNTDGSWYGSWAVCYTYGTWFAIEALTQYQLQKSNKRAAPAIERAVQFLLAKQNEDGGWGERFESCIEKKYVSHHNSQVVNTSWALLSLMAVKPLGYNHYTKQIERGIRFIIQLQQASGDWEQESISGVFNHNCMISYTAYRNVFPIWALGRFIKQEKI